MKRRIVVLVVPPVEELDLVGPVQVLSAANRLARNPVYSVEIVTNGKDLEVEGEGGLLSFLAQQHYRNITGSFDSLLLVCGVGTRNTRDPALFSWLREIAPKVRRLGSVCAGALLLAEAGLLDRRSATSHWRFSDELAKGYPKVTVVSEPVWLRDGNIYTSAGISAGIDLGLAWVEEDCGNSVAMEIAREFVLFLRRPSCQAQISISLAAQDCEMRSIQELLVWIAEHLDRNLPVQSLADRVAMSARNFERVFRREVGIPPAHYVRQLRAEAAQRLIQRRGSRLEQIALRCGFSSADSMRRILKRTFKMRPSQSAVHNPDLKDRHAPRSAFEA